MNRKIKPQQRPLETLKKLSGHYGGSVGQWEQLAGINIQSDAERTALWNKFRHLFGGDSQTLTNAVMDHVAEIAIKRVKAGELCLVPARY